MELTYVILVLLSICFVSLSLEDAWINDFTLKTRGLTEKTVSTSDPQNKIQGNEAAKLENTISSSEGIKEKKHKKLNTKKKGNSVPNYCLGIDNEITRLKNEKESIESKLNFFSDMKLLLNENEKLKAEVSQLQQELKDKEATILSLKEECNSFEKTILKQNSYDQIYNEGNFRKFLVERFKPTERQFIGESSENQVNKRNSIEILNEDEPESSVKKQKTQTDLNTYFTPIFTNKDLSNGKNMDEKQEPIKSSLTPEIKVSRKLRNTFIEKQKLHKVYVPCDSEESAKQAVLDFGGKNDCNTPLGHVIKPQGKNHAFPFYSLGWNNQPIVVEKDGIYYDYRFYYGIDANGFKARLEKGCDKPFPHYHDKFVIRPVFD